MKHEKTGIFEELWNNPKFLRIFVPIVLLIAIFWRKIKPVLTGKVTWEEVLRSLPDSFWIGFYSVLGLLLLGVGAGIANFIRLRKKADKEEKWIRILPSRSIPWDTENILSWVQSFGEMGRRRFRWLKGNTWFRFRIVLPPDSKEIALYLGYPKDREESVWNTIQERYPSAEIYRVAKEEVPVPEKGGKGGVFWFRGISGLPLASLKEKKASPLSAVLAALRPGTYLELQFSPVRWGELEERTEEAYEVLQSKKAKELSTREKARKHSLVKRFTGKESAFRLRLSVWSTHWKSGSVVFSMVNAIQTEMNHHGKLRLLRLFWNPMRDTSPMPLPIPFTIMSWSGDELANLFHLPEGESRIYVEPKQDESRGFLPALSENQRTPEDWELSKGIRVGRIKHPIIERDIRIDEEQLTKHFLLTGAPGMGKSSLLVEMIDGIIREWIKDPENHPGFTFIDPAQETIAIIFNRLRYYEECLGWKIPKHKIRYFDLTAHTTHPLALNLLHVPEGTPKNVVARTAADVILGTTGSSESLTRSKRLLRLAIHSLLDSGDSHTVLGIKELLTNEKFRKQIEEKVKDVYLKKSFKEFEVSQAYIEPILNRLDPLLSDLAMRRIYCQPKMSLDIKKYMDEGYLVFMNVKGMGNEEIRITVGHLIAQYHYVAKQRLAGSKLHLLMIDEAHLVQVPILAKIIAEDRKYALGLGLITQDVAQIHDSELVTALNLIGTVMSCAQNEGASRVSKMTDGVFAESFIRRLPERNCAIFTRSKYEGRSHVTTCVVENQPPVTYLPNGKIANFRNHENAQAQQWGLEWAKRIMERQEEVEYAKSVDEWIDRYMTGNREEKEVEKTPQKSKEKIYVPVDIPTFQQSAHQSTEEQDSPFI